MHMSVHMHIHVHNHVLTHVHAYTVATVHRCMCINTWIYMHVHEHTHVHTELDCMISGHYLKKQVPSQSIRGRRAEARETRARLVYGEYQ